jgi:hypothetical protein
MPITAAVARHYRVLTPVARPMQMPSSKARQGAGARPEAFSSEVDTGSREENASNKDLEPSALIQQNRRL